MRVQVITAPQPVITLGEAIDHLRIDSPDDDALVMAMIAAATGHIDGPTGWLGRSIGVQTLEAYLAWPDVCGEIRLLYGPVTAIAEIAMRQPGGSWLVVGPTVYEQRGDRVALNYGQVWPTTLYSSEAVRIRYEAGYIAIPAPIRAAILLMVGDLYANRESTVDGRAAAVAAVPMSTTVQNLLAPFQVYA